jgi:hypothetical protein
MGTPLHLWLTDDGNAPIDRQTGRLMGQHSHRPLTIE